MSIRVHFLDVGDREYGDAVLCELGETTVLIDGGHPGDQRGSAGHPSIPAQLQDLLDQPTLPVEVDLLVVTHAHQDHVGCLPFLVQHDILKARWALAIDPALGWGRSLDDPDDPAPPDDRVRALVGALREERPSPETDDPELARIMADAASLEDGYRTMLDRLEAAGTNVIRHGRDDPAPLLDAFAHVGLELLGPTDAQLIRCAAIIRDRTQDALGHAGDAVHADDGARPDVDYLRTLLEATDAGSRPGPAINLQSLVTRFELEGRRLLFAGDMQFADPQLGDPPLREELRALRARIKADGPYDVVKLSHHGSDNAFDARLLEELGNPRFVGICAGEDSTAHPHPAVLRVLDQHRGRLRWVRTDHNGLSTIRLSRSRSRVIPARGEVNDARPNTPDMTPAAPVPVAPAAPPPAAVSVAAGPGDPVEVITRVPPGVRRVVVTIDVERGADGSVPAVAGPGDALLRLAGGRALPPLLFVTERGGLARNVGEREAGRALQTIREAGATLHELPPGIADGPTAVASVRDQLRGRPDVRGVVLVGGYDVVPSLRRDCLPPALRAALGRPNGDADDFYVWSDDSYGDVDGRTLPVSRVPDGRSAQTLTTALSAGDQARPTPRGGVRNVARPFAEDIYARLQGATPLLVSQPATFSAPPPVDADLVYLMLHGDFADATRFWGEGTDGNAEAVNLTNVTDPGARVVFTGCCWGALTIEQPAQRLPPGTPPAPKTANASLALRFLECGATAFVGCTGSHYSPIEPPYGYFGGPMHQAFFAALADGRAPAEALLDAKADYVRGFPHGRRSQMQQAIEYKLLHQFTCLGLGW